MFERITPEEAGVSSRKVAEYISCLERRGVVMHSVLMLRHGKLFAEYYWAPFHKDHIHRMYSQTKSYVSMAIGILISEGKLSLDDKVYDYFKDRAPQNVPPYIREQTVRNMLTMSTSDASHYWFASGDPDRVHHYFCGPQKVYPAGTYWEYDSAGSMVLGILAEKLSGMKLLDFLRSKAFDRMGTFKNARILQTPNGDTWGDSALCCTSRDMASAGYLASHFGEFEGEQLLPRDYMTEMTKPQVSNADMAFAHTFSHGYGYQIWCTEQNGFAFSGMGGQYTVCLPDRDFVFVCTGDNQGYGPSASIILDTMFDQIVIPMKDEPLPADPEGEEDLAKTTADLKLAACMGNPSSELAEKINGVTFICDDNQTGITRFRFDFNGEKDGTLTYSNAQGEKKLAFGLTTNVFGKFPQYGYADERGGVPTTNGFLYDCASSAGWLDQNKLMLRVQIIDKYFGNMFAIFAFNGDLVYVNMAKNAEDFLGEYRGSFLAKPEMK